MNNVTPGADGWVKPAYEACVSMGGELKASDAGGALTFAFWAIKDPDSGHYFYPFSDEMKIRQVLVGAEASVSRHDVEKALGDGNAHVERIKTRAAFQTFNVVRNRNQSLWR